MKPLPTRTIKCYPKSTSADTQYWDMDTADEQYVYDLLTRYMADMMEKATHESEMRDLFFQKSEVFPLARGRRLNSIASTIGGIVGARIRNPQKNLSTPQLDILEVIIDVIADHYSQEPEPPQAVVFAKSLLIFDR